MMAITTSHLTLYQSRRRTPQ